MLANWQTWVDKPTWLAVYADTRSLYVYGETSSRTAGQGHLFLTGSCHCLTNYCKNVKRKEYIYLPGLPRYFEMVSLDWPMTSVLSIKWTPNICASFNICCTTSSSSLCVFNALVLILVLFIYDELVQSAVNVIVWMWLYKCLVLEYDVCRHLMWQVSIQ